MEGPSTVQIAEATGSPTFPMPLQQMSASMISSSTKKVMQFISKSASQLRDDMIQDHDEFGFPPELNVFKSKKVLLALDVTEYNVQNRKRSSEQNTYIVLFISDNEDYISNYNQSSVDNQEHQSAASSGLSLNNCTAVDRSTTAVSSTQKKLMFDFDVEATVEGSLSPDLKPASSFANEHHLKIV